MLNQYYIKMHGLLVRARTTTSVDYSYGFLNIAQTLLPVFTHDVTRSGDLLTYVPHPNTCFALRSRLDHLRGYSLGLL